MKKTAFLAGMLLVAAACSASAARVYDSIPDPQPYNLPSLGYQATQTLELGDKVSFAGTERNLSSVTVGLSNWAKRSDYMELVGSTWATKSGFSHVTMNENGFYHDLTFNLYSVGAGDTVGSLISTQTISALVAWRPENNPADNSKWLAADGKFYSGYFTTASFDFSAANLTLPNELIYGLAFNTNTWGYNPIGLHGPYESLNFALATDAYVGSTDENSLYWNTKTAAWYTDGGAGGVGTFRTDTNWGDYVPAVEFNTASPAVPEPMSIMLGLMGLGSIAGYRKLRK